MKRTLTAITIILLISLALIGCVSTKGKEKEKENIHGTVLGDSVIELDVITEID